MSFLNEFIVSFFSTRCFKFCRIASIVGSSALSASSLSRFLPFFWPEHSLVVSSLPVVIGTSPLVGAAGCSFTPFHESSAFALGRAVPLNSSSKSAGERTLNLRAMRSFSRYSFRSSSNSEVCMEPRTFNLSSPWRSLCSSVIMFEPPSRNSPPMSSQRSPSSMNSSSRS